MNISDYYDGADKLTADHGSSSYFKISPSQAANFFSSTRQWYGENLLDEPGFEGSDSTVLGTIVHYFAEQASLKVRPENPDKLVSDYLDSQTVTDRADIESLWRDMSNTLIQGCIHGQRPPIATELFMFHKLLPGIYVAGTTDAIVPTPQGAQEPDYYVKVL